LPTHSKEEYTMTVCVLLADGFEESEVVVPVDLLRRGGVDVILAGVYDRRVTSSHHLILQAETRVTEVALEEVDLVFVPGGLGGVNGLLNSPEACAFLREAAQADKYLAAICAGPTVLSRLGLIDGKKAVCYPGCETMLPPALFQPNQRICQDGKLLTAQAAGSAFDLGLAMLEVLMGQQCAKDVAQSVCYG
jgi:4-methyl-5(b-hydroxyethyl)-thiazole monophosphate biosynthesis